MKTAIQSDHIWDMLKRRSTTQMTVRRYKRALFRRLRGALPGLSRDHR